MRRILPLFVLLVAGCSADAVMPPAAGDGGGLTSTAVMALHDNSRTRDEFFALPWPADERLHVREDGKQHLNLSGYHYAGALIGVYLDLFHDEPTTGFGTSSAIYFRFDGPIDPSTLPGSALDSLRPDASVFLVDVGASSPTVGRRVPVRVRFEHESGKYIGPDWLALLPEPGLALRERNTYMAVITDAVRGADGQPVRRDERYPGPPMALLPALGPGSAGEAAHIVSSTVFTTADQTSMMRELREAVHAQAPPPQVANFRYHSNRGRYDLYVGSYDAPNYQEGDAPYMEKGGRIHLGPDGKPAPVRSETLRFALSVPHGDMPKGGWPIVLYAHGTGGSWFSFVNDGSASDAASIPDENGKEIGRMAMISIDQVLHGPRDPTGADPELTFYNFQNLLSARDSIKQGALDNFSLLRLVEHMNVESAPGTGAPIRFDRDRVYFKGHSQGGSTGPLFLAYEPTIKAAVLSGAGAVLEVSLLGKTEPVNIPALVEALVGEHINEFHPLLNLMQTFLESADPNNYARLFFQEPPPGLAPKNIYQSLGIIDHYTPVPTMKALALGMGVQPVTPQILPIEGLPLTPLQWAPPPIAKNVAGGAATGVLCQYKVPMLSNGHQPYDGHFVVFNHPDAVRQSNAFLATHAATGTAQLIP